MSQPEWIEEAEIGAAVPESEQPAWLAQFADFLRANRLPATGELLLRCRACDLALALSGPALAAPHPETLLSLAHHGLAHALNGELRA